MIKELNSEVKRIVSVWSSVRLEDTSTILDLRRKLSILYGNFGEIESEANTRFVTYETERKNEFNRLKLDYIQGGDTATVATTKAESDIRELREKEVIAEREYKSARVSKESLGKVLDSMASVINFNIKDKSL